MQSGIGLSKILNYPPIDADVSKRDPEKHISYANVEEAQICHEGRSVNNNSMANRNYSSMREITSIPVLPTGPLLNPQSISVRANGTLPSYCSTIVLQLPCRFSQLLGVPSSIVTMVLLGEIY